MCPSGPTGPLTSASAWMESECVDAGRLAVKAVRTSLGTPVAMCQCPAEGKMASASRRPAPEPVLE